MAGEANQCLTCTEGNFFTIVKNINGTCTPTCGDGTFKDGTVCAACDEKCLTCDKRTTCLSCANRYYIHSSSDDGLVCELIEKCVELKTLCSVQME